MRSRFALVGSALVACGGGTAIDPGTTTTTSVTTTTSSGVTTESSSGTAADTSSTGEPVDPPPACGSLDYPWQGLVAGPGEAEHDAELEAAARLHDRLHLALASLPLGLAGDLSIALDDEAARAAIESFFAAEGDDFAAATGEDPREVLARWEKATGAFAGVAAAADAYRYGTLRDQGYDCDEVASARAQVVRAADALHLVTAVTGEPGQVARALTHRDWPGASETPTVPLFDAAGDPQPPEKTNGTFREDASGRHPEIVWEDACSRDQIIGWAIGIGAVWEVIRNDPEFDDGLRSRLRDDAAAMARQLMTVRDSGFDLEIWDPDGRPTPNGYLHENNVDGLYVGFLNGQHAVMATGIVAALAFVADDPEITAYLVDGLIEDRNLMGAAANGLLVDFGAATNHSNYNMAFSGIHLVTRYVDHPEARADLLLASERLYRAPGADDPVEVMGQGLFDLLHAAATADASARGETTMAPEAAAVERGLAALRQFPTPPAWDFAVTNCDDAEIAGGSCVLNDDTVVAVLGAVGHNDALVVDQALPLAIRPPSNFYWRSNPFEPNGGGEGTALASSADFRFAYWMGRFTRRAP